MPRPVLLILLLMVMIFTSQLEWRRADEETTPDESQKQLLISQREENVKDKVILSQEKNIQKLNDQVHVLREQLQHCLSHGGATVNVTFSS